MNKEETITREIIILYSIFKNALIIVQQQQKSNTQIASNKKDNTNGSSTTESPLSPQPTNKSASPFTSITKSNMQQHQIDYHSIVAPKPFKKAFVAANTNSGNSSNQV